MMEQTGPPKMQFTGTANILQARHRLDTENGIESMSAFHRWRMASMKTQYGRQLRGILEDVQRDENRLRQAQSAMASLRSKEAEMTSQVSQLRVENSRAAAELERFVEDYNVLHATLREVTAGRDVALSRAEAAESSLRLIDASGSATGVVEKSKMTAMEQDLEALRAEQAKLMDTVAERDSAVASMGQESKAAKQEAARMRAEMDRMEGIVRATGEHAAVAEARASELEVEIATLRQSLREDYAEQRRLKAAAGEVEDYKKQVADTMSLNASLAKARDDMRDAMNATSQRLAAAEGRNASLSSTAQYVSMLKEVFEGTASSDLNPMLAKLGLELDKRSSELAGKAGDVERLNACVSQLHEQIAEQKTRISSLEQRNRLLEDATRKNRQLQVSLEEVADKLAEEKSNRVAAEHRATSLASQNSLKDYILRVRAKTADEDVAAALERLTRELDQRTEDAAALAGRASLAESRLDDVTSLQTALANKISELETLRAVAPAAQEEEVQRRVEMALLPGAIQGPSPTTLVPQEALEAAERRRAQAEAEAARLRRMHLVNADSVAAFVERVSDMRAQADLMKIFSRWRALVSTVRRDKYLKQTTAKSHLHMALARLAGRHNQRTFLTHATLMFCRWRAAAARTSVVTGKWEHLATTAAAGAAAAGGGGSIIRTRRERRGGFVLQQATEQQVMRLALQGWRTHTTECKLDDLTAALPLWIERIGEKRCIERHWMSWRIAVYAAKAAVKVARRSALRDRQQHSSSSEHECSNSKQPSSDGAAQRTAPRATRTMVDAAAQSPPTAAVAVGSVSSGSPLFTLPDYRLAMRTIPGSDTAAVPPHMYSPTHYVELPRAGMHDYPSGGTVGTSGRSVSAPPHRYYGSSHSRDVSPEHRRSRQVLKKGSGRGGMPNKPRGRAGSPPMFAFGHHINPEDEVAVEILEDRPRSQSPPRRWRRSLSPPDHATTSFSPRLRMHSQEVLHLPEEPPVVAAFGSTVSHDPQALRIALGQPTMQGAVEPDRLPFLPASVSGPARKARAVERVVDALAHTMNQVAESLAQTTTRADNAIDRLHTSTSVEQLREGLVRQGLTGTQAFGTKDRPRILAPSGPPGMSIAPYRERPTSASGMAFTRARASQEHLNPRRLAAGRPLTLRLPEQAAEASAPEEGAAEEPRQSPINSPTFQRQAIHRQLSGAEPQFSTLRRSLSQPLASGRALEQEKPNSPRQDSPRSRLGPASPRERGISVPKLSLPGTSPLSPRERREFENLLTAGATGFSPRELRDLQERGVEVARLQVPLSHIEAGGSHLTIQPGSGPLRRQRSMQPLDSSGYRQQQQQDPSGTTAQTSEEDAAAVGTASAAHRPQLHQQSVSQKITGGGASASHTVPSGVAGGGPAVKGSPGTRKGPSRLLAPTAASIHRVSAIQRSVARREAEELHGAAKTAQPPSAQKRAAASRKAGAS